MTDYPYEGDLTAVFEAVTIPRIVKDALKQTITLFGIPDIATKVDAMLAELADDIWWAADMARKRAATAARHQEAHV